MTRSQTAPHANFLRESESGPPRPKGRGNGIVLLCVVVCLGVATLFYAALIKEIVAARNQSRKDYHRAQATRLADAGVERAVAQLHSRRDYAGETWKVPVESFDRPYTGLVVIEVSADEGEPRQRNIRVHADFPEEASGRARRLRELRVVFPEDPPR